MGKVDPDDPRPPYQQVADDLRTAIQEGVLAPGQRLAKQADLVGEYGVSLGTVRSALAVFRDESLIISRQGEGSWVRRTPVDQPAPADEDEPDTRQMFSEVLDWLTEVSRRLESVTYGRKPLSGARKSLPSLATISQDLSQVLSKQYGASRRPMATWSSFGASSGRREGS